MIRSSSKFFVFSIALLFIAVGTSWGQVQDISADRNSHDFGELLLGTSADQVFIITNVGVDDLTISNSTFTGQNANQFLIASGGGGVVLGAGASQAITVRFLPTTPGVKVAALRISSNDPDENPFDLPLTGTSISPEISISGSLAFGDVKVGQTRRLEIVVTNSGSSSLTVSSATISGTDAGLFRVVPGRLPFTIDIPPAAPRDTIRVDFTPTVGGDKNAFLTIFSDDFDESEILVSMTGRGVRPDISVDPGNIDFGDVAVGGNATIPISVTNTGNGSLVIAGTELIGNDPTQFQVTSGGGGSVIAPGNTRTLNVRFSPSTLGARDAVLRITSDDPDENPVDIRLAGTGIGLAEISINRNSANYGNVRVGGSSIQEFVVTNLGLSNLRVNVIPFTGPNPDQFVVQTANLPFDLAPLERDTIRVEFRPTSTGNKSAFLNVTSNDPNELVTQLLVFGDGVLSNIVTDQSSLDFGDVAVGSTAGRLLTITNLGTGNLVIFGTEITGDSADQFRISSNSGSATVPPNSSRIIGIEFVPTSFGSKSATLRIESDDPDQSPLDIPMSGSGFGQPDIAVNRTVIAFNNVRVGSTSVQEVIVTNTGLAKLQVTDATFGGTDADLFATQSGNLPMNIEPTGRDTLRILFTPASGGNKSASVFLASNDPDENPVEIILTGEGVRPELQWSDSAHDFGELAAGTTIGFSFTLSNAGSGNLNISETSILGGDADQFSISFGGGAATIAPGGSRVIEVEFAPTSTGQKTAALRIVSDDLVSPALDIQLVGLGQSITLEVASVAPSGQDVAIGVTFPAGFPATGGTLFYRLAGETIYRVAEMSAAGNDGIARIPGSAATVAGIEYYVVATNDIETITLPLTDPQTQPLFLPVRVSQLEPPVGIEFLPLVYRMISVPAQLDDPSIRAVLGDDFDEYNTRRWRLFRWENGDYEEYPNISASFTPGNGFWLVTSDGASFDIDAAESIDPATPLNYELVPGWNQIGNPYAFPLTWPADFIDPGIEDPVSFDGSEFEFGTSVLNPWEGYFVYNAGNSTVSVPLSPRNLFAAGGKTVAATAVPAALLDGEYTIQLTAQIPGTKLRDSQNFIGLRSGAHDGRDQFDFAEPPPIGTALQLSSIENGEVLAGNFKRGDTPDAYWDFILTGPVSNMTVEISFETAGVLPDGAELFVLDLDDQRALQVDHSGFSVDLPETNEVKHIRVIVGSPAYAEANAEDIPLVPMTFQLEQNYPNPFNPETNIRYTVETPTRVRLEIFDILGRKIRTLVNDRLEAGVYDARWDGLTSSGIPVASGTYVYRLESGNQTATRTMIVLR